MRPVRLALALAVACSASACGEDPPPSGPPLATAAGGSSISARIETFIGAPDYATLVNLLRQGHAVARAQLGPHRLRYNASFTTGPAELVLVVLIEGEPRGLAGPRAPDQLEHVGDH